MTAILFFAVMQSFPIMDIELHGLEQAAGIGSGVTGLLDQGLPPLALLVLFASTAAPLFRLLANAHVLTSLRFDRRPGYLATIFRLSEQLRPWAMLDVLLLGTLVTMAKLRDLAGIDIGVGFWSLALAVLTLAGIDSLLDRRAVWRALAPMQDSSCRPDPSASVSCLSCGLVHPQVPRDQRCRRCRARLFRRKPESVGRTWALVLTGGILYVPANAYPALTVISFGHGTTSTILGGVVALMTREDWPLALLIFTASVAVPVLKLLGLASLLVSIQCRLRSRILDRTRLYRIVEFIGRWSMIDVFVAALLTALVTLGQVATVEPGIGLLAFGAVVVTTMLAAKSFDPRLMWDAAEPGRA